MATLEEVAKIMGVLSAAYPGFALKPETIKIYAKLLEDIPTYLLEKAAFQAAASSEFFPTIAKIRTIALDLQTVALNIPSGPEAWEEVMQFIRLDGHGYRPQWSHPLIGKAVNGMGGFDQLCLSENIDFDRTQFYKVYDQLFKRADQEVKLLPELRNDHALPDGGVSSAIGLLTAKLDAQAPGRVK